MFVLYQPVLFLHIFFGFVYMLSHGASAAVAYRLRFETNLDRVRALLDLSASSFSAMYLSLLGMIAGGIALGFLGRWWSSGWIWLSLGLLVLILVLMWFLASKPFHLGRKAAGMSYLDGTKEHPAEQPASPQELEARLKGVNPNRITAFGLGGWAVILWLMIFKPF